MKKISLLLIFVGTFLKVSAQATTCATATNLIVNGACGSGLVSDATIEPAPGTPVQSCNGAASTREAWFKFTAVGTNANINAISSAATTGQMAVQIFSGTCGALSEIGCADNSALNGAQTEFAGITSGLTNGAVYYIRVLSKSAANVTLSSLCVTNTVNPYTIPACGTQFAVLSANMVSLINAATPTVVSSTIPLFSSSCAALTISANLNGGPTSPTYYSVCGSNYYWWNGTTSAWVNTNHTAGPSASYSNIAAGGGYIYALEGTTGNVYRYNGTGNASFFATIPFTSSGPFDMIADNLGNLYVMNTSSGQLQSYSASTASLICTVSFSGTVATGGGGGFAIVGNTIVAATALNYYSGTMSGTSAFAFSALANPFTPNTATTNGAKDFASCAIAPICPVILPVDLLNFDAVNSGEHVRTFWTTSSEHNSDHFAVMRSQDGQSFTQIGTVQAAGTSSMSRNYEFYDEHPYAGLSYYQLMLYDIDGTFKYANLAPVYRDKLSITNLFPNPGEHEINIEVVFESDAEIKIEVLDMTGRIVMQDLKEIKQGKSVFQVDVSQLAKGIYSLKIKASNLEYTERNFIK